MKKINWRAKKFSQNWDWLQDRVTNYYSASYARKIILRTLFIVIVVFAEIWALFALFGGIFFTAVAVGQVNCFFAGQCNGNFTNEKDSQFSQKIASDLGLQLDTQNNLVSKMSSKGYIPFGDNGLIISQTTSGVDSGYHFFVPSGDHKLSAYVFKTPVTNLDSSISYRSKQYVVIVHGASSDWTSSYLLGQQFLKEGYNIIVYNHPGVQNLITDSFGFNGSSGVGTTYGYKESDDLHTLIKWFVNDSKVVQPDENILVYGSSLGAATTMLYLDKYGNEDMANLRLKGATEDSGYAHLVNEFQTVARTFGIAPWLVQFTGVFFIFLAAGFDAYQVNPIDGFDKVNVPCFFTQGSADTYVPYKDNFWQLFQAYKGPKQANVLWGAEHTQSSLYELTTGGSFYYVTDTQKHTEGLWLKPWLSFTDNIFNPIPN